MSIEESAPKRARLCAETEAMATGSDSKTKEGSRVPKDLDLLLLRPSPYGNETGELPSGVFEPGVEVWLH
jgi:hypothetical protein